MKDVFHGADLPEHFSAVSLFFLQLHKSFICFSVHSQNNEVCETVVMSDDECVVVLV